MIRSVQRVTCRAGYGSGVAVEIAAGEGHELVRQQLDADAVGVAQIERLRDSALRPVVGNARFVQLLVQHRVSLRWHGDRDVLHRAVALLRGLQSESGKVEEAEQREVALFEEEVRRA